MEIKEAIKLTALMLMKNYYAGQNMWSLITKRPNGDGRFPTIIRKRGKIFLFDTKKEALENALSNEEVVKVRVTAVYSK